MTDKESEKFELLEKKAKTGSVGEIACMLYVDKLVRSLQKDGYDIDKGDFTIERRVACENSPMCVKYGDMVLPVGMYCVVRTWEHNDLSLSKTLKQNEMVNALHNLHFVSSKEFEENIKDILYEQAMNHGYSDDDCDSFGEFLTERD